MDRYTWRSMGALVLMMVLMLSITANTASAGVVKSGNIYYKNNSGLNLYLDLYRNTDGSLYKPVFVYIHSGGWVQGSKDQEAYIANAIAKLGVHVVSINYSLAEARLYPQPLYDVACALKWVSSSAGTNSFDLNRVYIGGYSAGAQLALLYSLNPAAYSSGGSGCPFYTSPARISKTVSVAGPTDLRNREIADPSLAPYVARFLPSPEDNYEGQASPIQYVNGINRNGDYLFIHGTADKMVNNSHSQGMYNLMRALGYRASMVSFPNRSHYFFLDPSASSQDFKDIIQVIKTFLGLGFPLSGVTTYKFSNVTAGSVLSSSYAARNVIDNSLGTSYSSIKSSTGYFGGNEGMLAAWFPTRVTINKVVMYPRTYTSWGLVQAFPRTYDVYVTDYNNTRWVYQGTYSTQPDILTGVAVVRLPSTVGTYGVSIVPRNLGKDFFGDYYFQLAELRGGL